MAKRSMTINVELIQMERLDLLTGKTKVPRAEYIRQGIDLILDVYEPMLGPVTLEQAISTSPPAVVVDHSAISKRKRAAVARARVAAKPPEDDE